MSTPRNKSAKIKYKNGKQYCRISFDCPFRLGRDFKDQMIKEGRSMASVLRPAVQAYMDAREVDGTSVSLHSMLG